jgi:hypothetical protein
MLVRTGAYRIVQPYGPDVARQSTVVSEHATIADAFAEIDRLAAQMVRTGARPDTVTLLVVDAAGAVTADERVARMRGVEQDGERQHAARGL